MKWGYYANNTSVLNRRPKELNDSCLMSLSMLRRVGTCRLRPSEVVFHSKSCHGWAILVDQGFAEFENERVLLIQGNV